MGVYIYTRVRIEDSPTHAADSKDGDSVKGMGEARYSGLAEDRDQRVAESQAVMERGRRDARREATVLVGAGKSMGIAIGIPAWERLPSVSMCRWSSAAAGHGSNWVEQGWAGSDKVGIAASVLDP